MQVPAGFLRAKHTILFTETTPQGCRSAVAAVMDAFWTPFCRSTSERRGFSPCINLVVQQLLCLRFVARLLSPETDSNKLTKAYETKKSYRVAGLLSTESRTVKSQQLLHQAEGFNVTSLFLLCGWSSEWLNRDPVLRLLRCRSLIVACERKQEAVQVRVKRSGSGKKHDYPDPSWLLPSVQFRLPVLLMRPLRRSCFWGSILVLKVGAFLPNTFCLGARQPCLLVVSISVCHTSTWLARSCNATKPKSQGPAHGR